MNVKNNASLLRMRLHGQLISQTPLHSAGDVVHTMLAIQAQDYAGAKWSIGLRLPGATDETIENAIAEKQIVRSWVLRNTLHFVSPKDLRWMLTLLKDRLLHAATQNAARNGGVDEKMLRRANNLIVKALEGGNILTREELADVLLQKKLPVTENRMSYYLVRAAADQLICFGPRRGNTFTFALLDEWLPPSPALDRETALATMAFRYLNSRAPATIKDFVWWSGLTLTAAREAFELVKDDFDTIKINEETFWIPIQPKTPAKPGLHLLPGFDEYIMSYTGRGLIIDPKHTKKIIGAGNGLLAATIVSNGQVIGIWKRLIKNNKVVISASGFNSFTTTQETAIGKVARRYGKFLALPVETAFS